MIRSTTEIKRQAPATLLAGLLSESQHDSKEAGLKLIRQAKDYGLDLKSYLRLAVDARLTADETDRRRYLDGDNKFVNGYEAALMFLNLPIRDDLDGGVMLQLAADTFNKFPGTRAMFPPVIDEMVRWRYRQTNFETTAGLISQSRTVAGTEMISTIVEDTAGDYTVARAISEGGRIPIHAIKTSEQSVKWWKFGTGYKTSYEFGRRASLDILTPYALRTQKQIEASKVLALTNVLINGDGINAAATVIDMSSYDDDAGATAVSGKLSVPHLASWFARRAQAGVPIDVVVGNWTMYIKWILTFALPTSNSTVAEAERLAAAGLKVSTSNVLNFDIKFELSSGVPDNQLLGYSVADTAEELIEAGSQIEETERSIQTQEVSYVKTETSGFRLIFGDTRSILDVAS